MVVNKSGILKATPLRQRHVACNRRPSYRLDYIQIVE